MAQAGLLLPKAPRRRQSTRTHEGRVSVAQSDMRWCSDGLEIKCDSGQTVTATFMKDCCDREVIAWRAWEGKGLPGEPVREMLIEAVERRFGSVDAVPGQHQLELLSGNGGAYVAANTRQLARSLGLTPINTPVCSPQSNGKSGELCKDLQTGLRLSYGLTGSTHCVGTVASRLRTLQRGASAFIVENAISQRVKTAAGCCDELSDLLRIGRDRIYRGKITRIQLGHSLANGRLRMQVPIV